MGRFAFSHYQSTESHMSGGIEWRGLRNTDASHEAEREQRSTRVMNGGVEWPAFAREDGKPEPEQGNGFTLLHKALDMGRETFKTWSFTSLDCAADYATTQMARDAESRDRWIELDFCHWRDDSTSEEWRIIANSPK